MPPAEPLDNQILTALVAVLGGIIAGANYWTSPVVTEGVPPDAIPSVETVPRLYVTHLRNDPINPEAAAFGHWWRARFEVWIAAKDVRTANRVRSDVLRAVYAAEGSMTASFRQPLWPDDFSRRDELERSGVHMSVQPFYLDYETDHTAV